MAPGLNPTVPSGPIGDVSRSDPRSLAVFSFVGVLGISLILFLVVAATGRLILGK
jgi:hypothetical protein